MLHTAAVCANAVRRTLAHGSTSAVYFGTIHTDAALLLGKVAAGAGQNPWRTSSSSEGLGAVEDGRVVVEVLRGEVAIGASNV